MSIDNIKSLVKAVLLEAERDRGRTISHAHSEVRRIKEQAQREAALESSIILNEAEEMVDNLLKEAQATTRLEAQSLKLAKRESMINAVFEQAMKRLASMHLNKDYGSIVHTLIKDTVACMEGVDTLIVDADKMTRKHLDQEVLSKLGQNCACKIILGDVFDDKVGVIVHSADGRLVYDNTFQARLERMRSSLRSPVFKILQGRD